MTDQTPTDPAASGEQAQTACAFCKGVGQVYDGPHVAWRPCSMCTPRPQEATDA